MYMFTNIICHVLTGWFGDNHKKEPRSTEAKHSFYVVSGFPKVIGEIDYTCVQHVPSSNT